MIDAILFLYFIATFFMFFISPNKFEYNFYKRLQGMTWLFLFRYKFTFVLDVAENDLKRLMVFGGGPAKKAALFESVCEIPVCEN